MTTLKDVELSYSIYKTLDDGLYLARRTTDGEILLARPLDTTNLPDGDNAATLTKLIHQNAARPAAQLLNHENLISIHDELVHNPLHASSSSPPSNPYDNNPQDPDGGGTHKTTRMLLWDHPDAGTLASLLADYDPAKTNFDPTVVGGFLPESFVWHVALSLLRALQWLHEGVRDTYAAVPVDRRAERRRSGGVWEKVRGKRAAEGDWWPVLHRDLRAGNVFLQHPRGVETYGAVKLGGFGRCFVASGAVGGKRETPVVAMERGDGVGLGVLRERMGRWKRDNLGVAQSERPYTQGSELFALGALLYRMMCGRELPPAEECDGCGCVHLTSNDDRQYRPCKHNCVGDVNIDEAFGPLFNYTADLKHLVMLLLRLNRNDQWWASDVLDIAWEGFVTWMTNTEDGEQYRDVFDGIIAQKMASKGRSEFDAVTFKEDAGGVLQPV